MPTRFHPADPTYWLQGYTTDGTHANDAGMAAFGSLFAPTLQQIIGR